MKSNIDRLLLGYYKCGTGKLRSGCITVPAIVSNPAFQTRAYIFIFAVVAREANTGITYMS